MSVKQASRQRHRRAREVESRPAPPAIGDRVVGEHAVGRPQGPSYRIDPGAVARPRVDDHVPAHRAVAQRRVAARQVQPGPRSAAADPPVHKAQPAENQTPLVHRRKNPGDATPVDHGLVPPRPRQGQVRHLHAQREGFPIGGVVGPRAHLDHRPGRHVAQGVGQGLPGRRPAQPIPVIAPVQGVHVDVGQRQHVRVPLRVVVPQVHRRIRVGDAIRPRRPVRQPPEPRRVAPGVKARTVHRLPRQPAHRQVVIARHIREQRVAHPVAHPARRLVLGARIVHRQVDVAHQAPRPVQPGDAVHHRPRPQRQPDPPASVLRERAVRHQRRPGRQQQPVVPRPRHQAVGQSHQAPVADDVDPLGPAVEHLHVPRRQPRVADINSLPRVVQQRHVLQGQPGRPVQSHAFRVVRVDPGAVEPAASHRPRRARAIQHPAARGAGRGAIGEAIGGRAARNLQRIHPEGVHGPAVRCPAATAGGPDRAIVERAAGDLRAAARQVDGPAVALRGIRRRRPEHVAVGEPAVLDHDRGGVGAAHCAPETPTVYGQADGVGIEAAAPHHEGVSGIIYAGPATRGLAEDDHVSLEVGIHHFQGSGDRAQTRAITAGNIGQHIGGYDAVGYHGLAVGQEQAGPPGRGHAGQVAAADGQIGHGHHGVATVDDPHNPAGSGQRAVGAGIGIGACPAPPDTTAIDRYPRGVGNHDLGSVRIHAPLQVNPVARGGRQRRRIADGAEGIIPVRAAEIAVAFRGDIELRAAARPGPGPEEQTQGQGRESRAASKNMEWL